MTVLVTGATGNTGRHVVAELVRRGQYVRALTRNPAESRPRLPAGVDVVSETHTASDTFTDAHDGVTRLHIIVTTGRTEVGAELVRRAMDAGVRRMPIVCGADTSGRRSRP